MLAVVKYKDQEMRVVFILGREGNKVFGLASEAIPANLVPTLSRILYKEKDLGKRIAILQKEFAPIYKAALRSFEESKFQVIQTYDQRIPAS